jgi:hypothetical protein
VTPIRRHRGQFGFHCGPFEEQRLHSTIVGVVFDDRRTAGGHHRAGLTTDRRAKPVAGDLDLPADR